MIVEKLERENEFLRKKIEDQKKRIVVLENDKEMLKEKIEKILKSVIYEIREL